MMLLLKSTHAFFDTGDTYCKDNRPNAKLAEATQNVEVKRTSSMSSGKSLSMSSEKALSMSSGKALSMSSEKALSMSSGYHSDFIPSEIGSYWSGFTSESTPVKGLGRSVSALSSRYRNVPRGITNDSFELTEVSPPSKKQMNYDATRLTYKANQNMHSGLQPVNDVVPICAVEGKFWKVKLHCVV